MTPRRKYEWQLIYDTTFRLEISSRNEIIDLIGSALCRFGQTLGRKEDLSAHRKGLKIKKHQTFSKEKVNSLNIEKQLQMHHPMKWKKYLDVWDSRALDPEAYTSFFEESKLTAFW